MIYIVFGLTDATSPSEKGRGSAQDAAAILSPHLSKVVLFQCLSPGCDGLLTAVGSAELLAKPPQRG